jgi:hypothetical protein
VEAPIWTGAMTFTSGGADAMVTSGGDGLLQLQEVAGVPLDGSAEEGARRAVVVVAEMILTKSGEGWRWSGHRCEREAEGRKRGARAGLGRRCAKGKERCAGHNDTHFKGGRWQGEKGWGVQRWGRRVEEGQGA